VKTGKFQLNKIAAPQPWQVIAQQTGEEDTSGFDHH